jgi:SAM-dependent methyltransferase
MQWLANKKNCDVYGLDLSPVAIKLLLDQGLNGVISELPNIPYPDDTFDVVVGSELIEHLDDPGATLVSARRVLKPGGLFIGTTPNMMLPPEEVPEHQRTWDRFQLYELFDGVFVDVHVHELVTRQGCTPYGDSPFGNKLRPLPILIGTGKKVGA